MTFAENKFKDVSVIGAGPVGMLAALSLAHNGFSVFLIGPPTRTDELRTTALMMSAIRMLKDVHVWDSLKHHAAALSFIKIIDITSRIARAPTVNFCSSEIGEEAFGYNIPNVQLNKALSNSVANTPNITRLFSPATNFQHREDSVCISLEDGKIVQSPLIVAADGQRSLAREAAGIGIKKWNYPQTALVLNFSHDFSHQNTSIEFHTEDGPFTQVPLRGHRSSLVWVVSHSRADELLGMEQKEIAEVIEEKMQSVLGRITIETSIQAWPLSGLLPRHFAANRTILVGEAAHVLPPIGAQGLNLGFSDIRTLIDVLHNKISEINFEEVVTHYNRYRKPDVFIRSGSVHMLNRALLSSVLPVHIMRSIGLGLLRHHSPLRSFCMREGISPGYGLKKITRISPINRFKKYIDVMKNGRH
ncbi:UbiH/UbiF family hydroxylase [Bartonella sp. CB178]|uniref:UbiH/UbiF family hydroxylase n=1 Tax=Bartonella sp. CB178 TaxID=3112255 RepID=UPI00300DBF3D